MTVTSIPTIDIAPYLDGSERERRRVADEINRTCEGIGFFFIKGHGVRQTLIDRTYHKAAEFFRLPLEDKLSIRIPSPEIARGYTPFLGETLSAGLGNAAPADLKEMIDMGPVDVPGQGILRAAGGEEFLPSEPVAGEARGLRPSDGNLLPPHEPARQRPHGPLRVCAGPAGGLLLRQA